MRWLRNLFSRRQLVDTYLLCWRILDTQILGSVVMTGRSIVYADTNSVESLASNIGKIELIAMERLTAKQANSCIFEIVALVRVGEEFKEY